ncbi:nuclear transport factor 2 family protein [Herbiconiux moechotypicola]|uniref:Oxalurate catabolism protein HpxZ n=1 Tax=Herbiconiux moechotypicola TaxID=637393 RepID=A0ABP5Q3Y5_9MICO|nr:nuclear transport factor 2 family protein [Herbiconiux moechotypicola]MCS5729018.1 nuclear transport factor 2 family protein [Herbiconiux moechotypicola]
MIALDDATVIAEVTAASDAYEAALAAGDVEALVDAFWRSESTLRFGDDEELEGWEAIARFRREAGATPVLRDTVSRRVNAYGDDLASVHLVSWYPGERRTGRQSQWWLRTDEGWRVAEAHVSWPLRSARELRTATEPHSTSGPRSPREEDIA